MLCPAGTVTLGGTESIAWLLLSETATALAVFEDRATVHMLEALLPRVVRAQASEEICRGVPALAVRVKVWETPSKAAVKRAVSLDATAATVAVNVALLKPAPMLTLAGTVTFALPLESVTLAELAVAPVRVAVQVAAPGLLTVAGEQLRLLS